MSICFLNDKYLDLQEAKISPLDRGFLFGDAIYEVIIAVNKKKRGMPWLETYSLL